MKFVALPVLPSSPVLDYSVVAPTRFLLAAIVRLFEPPALLPHSGDVFVDPLKLVDALVVEAVVKNGWRREVLFRQGTMSCAMGLVPFLTNFVKRSA